MICQLFQFQDMVNPERIPQLVELPTLAQMRKHFQPRLLMQLQEVV
jgi:hypothetical protein